MADEPRADDISGDMEPPQIAARPVLWSALGAIGLMVGAIALFTAIYHWQVPNQRQNLPLPTTFPAPRVRTDETVQRRALESEQRQLLTGYAWAEPGKTLVRIPVERAMGLLVARGNDAYAPIVPTAGTKP